MGSVSVSRTLVKSPPEVWAELERDGRLAELLEIESLEVTVAQELEVLEWQAETASGRIEIKASGWGTKVSLTAEVDETEAKETVAEVVDDSHGGEEEVAVVTEPEVEAPPSADDVEFSAESNPQEVLESPVDEDDASAEPDSIADEIEVVAEKVAKLGFWARVKRLFEGSTDLTIDAMPGDDKGEAEEAEAGAEVEALAAEIPVTEEKIAPEVDQPAAMESVSETAHEPSPEPQPEPASQTVPVPEPQPEALATPDLEMRLTAVLDHLGAAHKRPFSSM